jgi:hypothetical protein
MAIAKRFGNIQPFFRTRSLDEQDRNGATEVGLVTYSDDTYEVTSLTVGARADHMTNALERLGGVKVTGIKVSEAMASDAELLRDKPEASADKSDSTTATEAA